MKFKLSLTLLCLNSLATLAGPGMIQSGNSPSPVAIQWANRGLDLFDQGDYPGAIEALFEAWKLNPEKANEYAKNLSVVYNNYAKKLSESGKDSEAITMLRRAVFYDESNATASQNLTSLLQGQKIKASDPKIRLAEARRLRSAGSVEEAVAEYLAAMAGLKAKDPDTWKAKLELAQVYQVLTAKYKQAPVGLARYERMASLLKELITAKPDDPKPYIVLGRGDLALDRLEAAIEDFESALKVSPSDEQALAGLVASWQKVLETAPSETNNLLGLGEALSRAGRPDEAEKYFAKAKSLKAGDKDLEKKIVGFKLSAQQGEALKLADKALASQKVGDFPKAIALYKKAIPMLSPGPELALLYYNLGLAQRSAGEDLAAKSSFELALKYNPNDTDSEKALLAMQGKALQAKRTAIDEGIALQNAGQNEKAIAVYKKLLASDPNDARIHFNLGTAYQASSNYDEALKSYKKASELSPSTPEYASASEALASAMKSGVFQASQADDMLREAIELQRAGQFKLAIQRYREALKLNPDSAQGHFNLATAYQAQKRYEEAVIEYQNAYRLDPREYAESNFFIASVYEESGRVGDALKFYRLYLEDQPNGAYSKQASERVSEL